MEEVKTYAVEADHALEAVVVRYAGPMQPQEDNYVRADAVALAGAHGFTRFLVDLRQAYYERYPPLEYYFEKASRTAYALPAGSRLATVYAPHWRTTNMSFLENVSTNRGVPLRFFDSYPAAVAWLRNDDAPRSL